MRGQNKRKNNSFITNQDLIEGMRNNSFRNLSKNFSSLEKKSSVTLIPKKNYQKENQNPFPKPKQQQTMEEEIAEVMKQLCRECRNERLKSKAQMALIRLREENKQPSKQENDLIKKIEELYIDKNKLKKQNKQLKEKLKLTTEREQTTGLHVQNEKLHKFILKQSQIINQQATQVGQVRQDLQRVIYSQAKSIENSLLLKF